MAIKTSRKRKMHRRARALERILGNIKTYNGEGRFLAKLEKATEHVRNLKAKLS
jgi:hypothetical protein